MSVVDAASEPPRLDVAGVPDAALRQTFELAVGIAAAGAKLRPPLPFPAALKPYLKLPRLDRHGLTMVRRALVADAVYRAQLGSVATDELVGAIGVAWLQQPPGWIEAVGELHAAQLRASEAADAQAQLKRADRRRLAAEQAMSRAQAEVLRLTTELQRERALRVAAETRALRAEQVSDEANALATRLRAETARLAEGLATAQHLAGEAQQAAVLATAQLAEVVDARDALLAERATSPEVAVVAAAVPAELADIAVTPATPRRAARRQPLAIPGGLYGDSAAVAVHFLRVPRAEVIVDGYNLAKQIWPHLALMEQRERCIDLLEDLVRRYATRILVAFDGADVVGANARRRLLRVQFSPAGVTADDLIRAVLADIAVTTAVIVVTDDQEIVASARAAGANVIGCRQLVSAAQR